VSPTSEAVRQFVLDKATETLSAKLNKSADKVVAKSMKHAETLDRLAAHRLARVALAHIISRLLRRYRQFLDARAGNFQRRRIFRVGTHEERQHRKHTRSGAKAGSHGNSVPTQHGLAPEAPLALAIAAKDGLQ
jgi:hypothetical protein